MPFFTYMLKCADESYYIDHTDNIEQRTSQHKSGKIDGYTASRLPIELEWMENFHTRDATFCAERKIKGWSRKKKDALIQGDWNMISLLSKNHQ